MINLGRNSGKGMPNVYIKPTVVDLIVEGLSILLSILTCVVTVLYYQQLSAKLNSYWLFPLLAILFPLLFIYL